MSDKIGAVHAYIKAVERAEATEAERKGAQEAATFAMFARQDSWHALRVAGVAYGVYVVGAKVLVVSGGDYPDVLELQYAQDV